MCRAESTKARSRFLQSIGSLDLFISVFAQLVAAPFRPILHTITIASTAAGRPSPADTSDARSGAPDWAAIIVHPARPGNMSLSSQWPPPEMVARLVVAAQSGSGSSVDGLLSTLRPALVGYFSRRLSDDDEAEDLAQAALMRIARALPTIEPDRADRFIVTIAANLVRTAYTQTAKKQRRWAPVGLANATESATAADRHVEYRELAREVHRICASELPPALKEVMLGVLRGETPVEIARRLEINPITVRTRLMRARAILRRELRAFVDLDDPETDGRTQLSA
ncbi:MAG: sigma-70 family RNA polymerase sigma factor [Gemmatimonas sp.]|nr:sigma-70 family RNA polymerase sigma factor [Gemmatimonas sp.]